ncbi:MAG: ATP-dependent RNA helicase DeaD [Polyangiales bacterium]|jgi:ATP-dependent RNA helicase DeaD
MTTTKETPEEQELTFSAMNLSAPIMKAIEEIGWDTPTPCQFQSFGPATAGRDLIVQSRTGTGKTAAFGLPLVDSRVSEEPKVQALILAPTRELALQSAREISRIGQYRNIATTAVYGGAPIEKQVRALADGAQIVSGTPGRVLDHLKRGTLNAEGLQVLVLDEADEMLSMGFAKELHAIMDLLPKDRQTLLYSATVDGPVRRMGERHMTDPVHLQLSGDAVGALGVTHYAYMVTGAGRARDLVKIIENEDPESAIVFCNTKAETEQVAAYLQKAGYSAAWLNGDLAQNDRERVMKSARDGELRFLVATDVAARGIDISHVTHVINFALPINIEQYVHRTGRTGRAGRTGIAMSLVAPQELGTLYYLRLQYSIFPIERSLPSVGEEKTRQETDRVEMLKAAFAAHATSDTDLAVAKRLLTHADAERILAGFVGSFFGTKADPDDEAASARRERKPRPAQKPRGEKREKREPREKREARGDKREKREPRSEKRAPRSEKREERTKLQDRTPTPAAKLEDRTPKPAAKLQDRTPKPAAKLQDRTPKPAAKLQDRTPKPAAKLQDRTPKPAAKLQDRTPKPAAKLQDRTPKPAAKLEDRTPKPAAKLEEHTPKPAAKLQDRTSKPAAKLQDRTSKPAAKLQDRTPKPAAKLEDRTEKREERMERPRRTPEERAARREERSARRESQEDARADASEPKAAEPKAAEPKAAEPKAAEPKAAEPKASESAAAAVSEKTETPSEAPRRPREEEEGFTRLYVNLGRKDGMRVGDLNEMFQEDAGLTRDEIGRIRLRDKHSFVSVPEAKVEAILASLIDIEVDGRELKVEVAKSS